MALPNAALTPPASEFLRDVLTGLACEPKTIAPKYFYDETGSALFDRICELPEYYPTRTERAILAAHAEKMATAIGPGVQVIEPGCGSCAKVRYLFDALDAPAGFVPVEISGEHMLHNLKPLRERYPGLPLHPLCADFTQPFALPEGCDATAPRLLFFPGSTLGNFTPEDARVLLTRLRHLVGDNGMLLLGVDLVKPVAVLEQAYNDRDGVTAAFNRNLLHRINNELGADFVVDRFRHRAVWNSRHQRIEMQLVAEQSQQVHVEQRTIRFAVGEPLITEYSYKYSDARVAALAAESGFKIRQRWTDNRDWFGIYLLDAC
ncbi:L-histidine N(alpha)-methyltransferase [Methylonatrum kenyense]|uniref:L-histidine N(alpha)-methyltransferase n=1 Tax=Methylonatrum kenyense TaxID=455253 RepID=UPI0020C13664|nr:L-histidine N(alpha)-methyltransferase [Methylonatrum kenyense]MCK8516695.1 L-histidine N(alpha)-methyltransferase [Methylonatrum kenyense]